MTVVVCGPLLAASYVLAGSPIAAKAVLVAALAICAIPPLVLMTGAVRFATHVRVFVDSNLGLGSIFGVELPLAEALPSSPRHFNSGRVAVVESDGVRAWALHQNLTRLGYVVEVRGSDDSVESGDWSAVLLPAGADHRVVRRLRDRLTERTRLVFAASGLNPGETEGFDGLLRCPVTSAGQRIALGAQARLRMSVGLLQRRRSPNRQGVGD